MQSSGALQRPGTHVDDCCRRHSAIPAACSCAPADAVWSGCCQIGGCDRVGLDVTRAFCRRRGSGGRCVTARMRPGELSRAPEASVMRGCGGDVSSLAMPIVDHCHVCVTTAAAFVPPARRRLPCCAQPSGEAVSGAAHHCICECLRRGAGWVARCGYIWLPLFVNVI
jgi:hypothetical protein